MENHIKNIQTILGISASCIATIGVIAKGANDLFIENIKEKFRNNIEKRSFLETIIVGIGYIIVAIDLLGIVFFAIIPVAGAIYAAYIKKDIGIIKEIPEKVSINNFSLNILETLTSIILMILMFAGMLGIIILFFEIKKLYIKKINNLLENNYSEKTKKYKKWSFILGGISALGVVVFSILIILFIKDELGISKLLALFLCIVINLISLIIYINFMEACNTILDNSKYIFTLKNGEVIICNLFLEYHNYFMISDKKLRYISKTEVDEISKYREGNKMMQKRKTNKRICIIKLIKDNYKLISGVFIVLIFLCPLLPRIKFINNIVIGVFGGSESAIQYMQYFGTVVGGLATLIAVFITVIQNRKYKKIDDLKLQIEYSKNSFEYSYQYQEYLDGLSSELKIILRRTDLLDRYDKIDSNEMEDDKENVDDYISMIEKEKILEDLDIESRVDNIFNKIEFYTKILLVESASILNDEVNTTVNKVFDKLDKNFGVIGNCALENKGMNEVNTILNNSNISDTAKELIYLQSILKEYITDCQKDINELIK
ncbi:hypothetical protein [Clostridium butyricum]|uniref:hypothetical protein n=1 Tax=Clostridium butyricum TaxID=1492 RepID=UPI0012B74213|nr:hypothetical protein [Clostridium butyricum]